jgi:hypothetical protein
VVGRPLNSQDVRAIAQAGRVAKHPRYHAHEKAIKFIDIAYWLATCFYVGNDRRPEHPDGYVAKCQWSRTHDLRVDFELATADLGETILVVTAMELTE